MVWTGAALAGLACFLGAALQVLLPQDTAWPGVKVEGVAVGGLSESAILAELQPLAAQISGRALRLVSQNHKRALRWDEAGITANLEDTAALAVAEGKSGALWHRLAQRWFLWKHGKSLQTSYSVDRNRLKAAIAKVGASLGVAPVDASARWANGEVVVVPGRPGTSVDVDRTAEAVLAELGTGETAPSVSIVMKVEQPEVNVQDLAQLDTILASYSTRFNRGQVNRTHNLRLAAAAVDKTLVRPGETFSYNNVVGPRLEKKGYKAAPIFEEGQVVPGIGGGVCQVATTVYNVALLAGLKIAARQPHSRPVTYAPHGRDATVAYPTPDLRFENCLTGPVYLRTGVGRSRVVITALGNHRDRVRVELLITSDERIPFKTVEKPDPSLREGERVVDEKGRYGFRTSLVRVIHAPGREEVRQVMSRSYYPPQTCICRVGPKPEAPTLPSPTTTKAPPEPVPESP